MDQPLKRQPLFSLRHSLLSDHLAHLCLFASSHHIAQTRHLCRICLNLDVIVLPELVYCNKCKTLVSTKSCPHGQHHQIKYHPDVIKELLFNGIMPPAILVRPEISALILSKLYVNRFKDIQKLCDDLLVNSGLLENKTDRDFYEELMKLYQTSSLT